MFSILGLPEGLCGVDIDFCLGLFTTIYILCLLGPHTENIFNKLDVYVTRAILAICFTISQRLDIYILLLA